MGLEIKELDYMMELVVDRYLVESMKLKKC